MNRGPVCAWSGLIPLERELRERVDWFIHLRWLAAVGILCGAWGVTTFVVTDLAPLPLYASGAAVGLYNAAFLFISRRHYALNPTSGSYRKLIYAQIAMDWGALVCLIHYGGGVQSPVPLAFIFHLIIGAFLLPRLACYVQAGIASLLLGVLIVLEQGGYWPSIGGGCVSGGLSCEGSVCLFRWLTLTLFMGVAVFLTTSITAPLRRKEESLFASEQALGEAKREMEALYEVAQVLNTSLDQDEVLDKIARNGAVLLGMKACSIRLLDEDGRRLRIGAAYGLGKAYLEWEERAVQGSRLGADALQEQTVRIRDTSQDPRLAYSAEMQAEGIRALLCVPLRVQGRTLGWIRVYASEVHEYSRNEESLLHNLANLGGVAIENARAYAEVQSVSEERAWFARMTHHQLRAPLAVVKSMLDALRFAGDLNAKQRELTERSRRRVDELLGMIRDLLDLAAAQRPRSDHDGERVELASCLQGALGTAAERATQKQVALTIDIAPGVAVRADADDMERIFSNLLDNAVKYTPAGGRVRFTATEATQWLVVVVEDSGIGIRAADQERVFQGFYRTEAAKSSGELGTGMGLSIVARLVARWGGELHLESEPGEGCRFTVRLPAAT